jgi:hypothetical protein
MSDDKTKAVADDLIQLTAKPTESMQDFVEEYEEEQNDFQGMYNAGGTFKQKLEQIAGSFHKGGVEQEPTSGVKEKTVEMVEEIPTTPETEKKPELKGYIEKVEKEAELTKPVVDDYTQQVLLKPAATQNPKIILPLTAEEARLDLKKSIWSSIKWLALWCIRQFKMLKGRAEYKQPENNDHAVGT